MANTTSHKERIVKELKAVGVTTFGLMKFSIRHLPNIIDDDEHIQAVIYGRYSMGNDSKFWIWEEGTLIATDFRILFVDRKPGFLRVEHISYDSVSGVDMLSAWPFDSVTLLSRVGNFSLRFVNVGLANRFVEYVKSRSVTHRPAAR